VHGGGRASDRATRGNCGYWGAQLTYHTAGNGSARSAGRRESELPTVGAPAGVAHPAIKTRAAVTTTPLRTVARTRISYHLVVGLACGFTSYAGRSRGEPPCATTVCPAMSALSDSPIHESIGTEPCDLSHHANRVWRRASLPHRGCRPQLTRLLRMRSWQAGQAPSPREADRTTVIAADAVVCLEEGP
jgi:hypothetical protein